MMIHFEENGNYFVEILNSSTMEVFSWLMANGIKFKGYEKRGKSYIIELEKSDYVRIIQQ